MEERDKRGVAMGSLGGGGFQQHGVGGRGLAFPAGVGSGWQIVGPASLKRRRICQNHWLSLTSSHSSPRLSWEGCSATHLGSTGWRVRRLWSSKWVRAGKKWKVFQCGGSSGVAGVLPAGTTTVGGEKKKKKG